MFAAADPCTGIVMAAVARRTISQPTGTENISILFVPWMAWDANVLQVSDMELIHAPALQVHCANTVMHHAHPS